jgi:hypothetical protein
VLVLQFGSRRRVSADRRGRPVDRATLDACREGHAPAPQSERLATDALSRPTWSGDTAGAALPQELRM